jgi:predicted phosphodiesterase
MTKLAILSDIHGNLPALEAVMADMKQFSVDQVIVAGDVINFGPFSRQTAEIVIEQNWPVIRGNNEFFLIDYSTPRAPAEWSDPLQFAPIAWLSRQFDADPKLKKQIAAWPDSLNLRYEDAPPIQVFHGTPHDPWDSIYWTLTDVEIEKLLSTVAAEFVICGHTHLPLDRQSGRWHVFNPGSVGVPLDGMFSASYMILEGNEKGWRPTFRRIPFAYEAIFEEFETSGYNHEAGPMGRLTLEIYKRARPVLGFLRWREKYNPGALLTHELVDEYLENANWADFAHQAYLINLD